MRLQRSIRLARFRRAQMQHALDPAPFEHGFRGNGLRQADRFERKMAGRAGDGPADLSRQLRLLKRHEHQACGGTCIGGRDAIAELRRDPAKGHHQQHRTRECQPQRCLDQQGAAPAVDTRELLPLCRLQRPALPLKTPDASARSGPPFELTTQRLKFYSDSLSGAFLPRKNGRQCDQSSKRSVMPARDRAAGSDAG